MNLSELFIRRPVMTILLMLALLFLGALSIRWLAMADMPNVAYPSISIAAELPGASPEIVAKDVALVLEKELTAIKGLAHISSSSWLGGCHISLQFALHKDMLLAAQEVERAINRAPLPRDIAGRPRVYLSQLGNNTVLYAVLSSSSLSPQELHHLAETDIEQPLSLLEGVSEMRISGASEAIEITLDPKKLAARELTIEEIEGRLEREGAYCPIGSLEGAFRRIGLYIPKHLKAAQDLQETLLSSPSLPVRLKDVGSVRETGLDIDHFRFIDRGSPATGLLIEVRKETGANVVALCKEIRRELERIQSTLPPTHQIKVILDQSVWIEEAVHDLQANLALALFLVAFVLFLFLRNWQDTLIPCIVLPLSLLGTCAAMYLLGYSLNLLSLMALTLAMGFVVDDAIVVLEHIARLREEGKTPLEAALLGSKQIGFTILSITCSLIAVFIPLIFMHGILGKLFREFSITLALAVLLSGILSLTLTPMLCARLSSNRTKKESKPLRFFSWYEPSLSWCLRHPKTTLAAALFSIACALMAFTKLPLQILPKEDLGWGTLSIQLPKGCSDKETEEYQTAIEHILSQDLAVECFASWLDRSGFFLFVRLVDPSSRPHVKEVLGHLEEKLEKIPGLIAWSYTRGLISFSLGESERSEGYSYQLRSHDLLALQTAAEELAKRMNTIPLFEKVDSDLPTPSAQLAIHVAREKAEQLGISLRAIQRALQATFAESRPLILEKKGTRIPVYLSLPEEEKKRASSLENVWVKSAEDHLVPLKAIASWEETLSAPHIQHISLLPAVSIHFTLAKGATEKEAIERLKELSEEVLSPSIRTEMAGETKAQAKLVRDMGLLLGLALLAMYLVLGILYESFTHPLTILSSLPFAGLGAGIFLLLFKQPLSLYSFVGLVLLVGVVKKNGIMLVDHALQSEKPAEEAIYEACLVRFRPIMMTTLAAFMGAFPIALGLGAGGETRRSLGIAICGGLLFSQMLTLYLTPVIYLYLHRKQKN